MTEKYYKYVDIDGLTINNQNDHVYGILPQISTDRRARDTPHTN